MSGREFGEQICVFVVQIRRIDRFRTLDVMTYLLAVPHIEPHLFIIVSGVLFLMYVVEFNHSLSIASIS